MFEPGLEATIVPSDPPRTSKLALWRRDEPFGDGEVELALPAGVSIRRRRVAAAAVDIADVIDGLVAMPADASVTDSVGAWSVAAKLAVDLIARGRIVPSRTTGGFDTWRIGPLDAGDASRITMLSNALPATAHALVRAASPVRVLHPSIAVDAFLDAVADTFPRTAVAAGLSPTHGGTDPVSVDESWFDTLLVSRAAAGLRVELVEDEPVTAVLTLRSVSDPSLIMDAATLWDAPESVVSRFGADVDADLLVSLRRGARVWSPVGRLLDHARPERLVLSDEEADELFGPVAEELSAAGIEVLWPADVFAAFELRPVISTQAPAAGSGAGLTLDAIAQMRWAAVLDGETLTEQEISELVEAKRPLVRVRGRWVRADPDRLERLRSRRRLGAGAALAAALSGTAFVDGEVLEVEVQGSIAELAERLGLATGPHELDEPQGLHADLRPYQRRGLAWLSEMCELGLGGVLADDMGLGKTLQILALHVHRQGGPTLVVCPASVIGNWEREARRFVPDVPVSRFHGSDRSIDDLDERELVITTYGTLRRDVDRLRDVTWGLVVADEAQAIKNPYARVSRAIRSIGSGVRVAMTGTPVENHLGDLWSILDWTTPGLLGPLESFRREVALPIERHRDPHVTDWFGRLVRPFLLRRRKSDPDIAPDLPAKIETDEIMPLTVEQATLYRATVADILGQIAESEGIERRGLVLKLLGGLKQICNHPAQFLGQPGPLAGRSGKLQGLVELLDVIVDEGDACLVFTQFVSMGRLLDEHLGSLGLRTRFLHGSVPVKRRTQMVDEFQSGDVDVFVISLKAGGTGLNLTRANHVIHYDRWWNPAVEDQASDRAWRIGQDRTVQVHRLVCEGTVEDRIASMLLRKRRLAEAVVGGGEGWVTELSDQELAALVELGGSR